MQTKCTMLCGWLCQIRVHSGQNPVKNSNEREAGVGLGRELLRGQNRPIGYNDRSKALTPCVDSGQDEREQGQEIQSG